MKMRCHLLVEISGKKFGKRDLISFNSSSILAPGLLRKGSFVGAFSLKTTRIPRELHVEWMVDNCSDVKDRQPPSLGPGNRIILMSDWGTKGDCPEELLCLKLRCKGVFQAEEALSWKGLRGVEDWRRMSILASCLSRRSLSSSLRDSRDLLWEIVKLVNQGGGQSELVLGG